MVINFDYSYVRNDMRIRTNTLIYLHTNMHIRMKQLHTWYILYFTWEDQRQCIRSLNDFR